jgi:hypothetical protein
MRCLLCFFLQNGCSGRGCLNNICIASYGVGAKFFTTNLMSVDIPQMTRRRHGSRLLREPPTNGTDTPPGGAAVSAAPNNCYSSHGMHGTHRTFLQRKDSHGWHGWTQMVGGRCSPTEYTELGSVGMAGMPYPPVNIRAHLWEALLCQKVPCVRSAGISFLPRMARMNTDGWGALFSHRIHRIGQRGYGRDAIPS